MPKPKNQDGKRPIESYEHRDKQRVNNPPVGLVNPDTDPDVGVKKAYAYDPHLDPHLEWAGKAEHTSFEVPTVSLHVHERIDPPYGIRYGSNFQPFVNKRDVKDGKDEDLTAEPEQILAFRDTWELGIHSYLTYLRDRLLLARELLTESGSIFVQISDENVHHVRELMDEVFGTRQFISHISFRKTGNLTAEFLPTDHDFILWYAKTREALKFRRLFLEKTFQNLSADSFGCLDLPDSTWRRLTKDEKESPQSIPQETLFGLSDLTSSHEYIQDQFEFDGRSFTPKERYWSTSVDGLERLRLSHRR